MLMYRREDIIENISTKRKKVHDENDGKTLPDRRTMSAVLAATKGMARLVLRRAGRDS